MNEPARTVSVREAADLLGVTVIWTYALIRKGRIETVDGRPTVESVFAYNRVRRRGRTKKEDKA